MIEPVDLFESGKLDGFDVDGLLKSIQHEARMGGAPVITQAAHTFFWAVCIAAAFIFWL